MMSSTACIIVVMNRKFAGTESFQELKSGWWIGTPKAVALMNESSRKYWNRETYFIAIPIAFSRNKKISCGDWSAVEAGVNDRVIDIDTVTVSFLNTGASLSLPISLLPPGSRRPVKKALYPEQGLFKSGMFMCLHVDSLDIPVDVDTILIDFDVLLSSPDHPQTDRTHLSYKLWRQEGKKLFLDQGP